MSDRAPLRLAVFGAAVLAALGLALEGPRLWPKLGLQPHVAPVRAANDPWAAYLAPESACPGGDDVQADAAVQARTMLCALNWARARRGLPELAASPALARSAQLKARDVVRCRDFSHTACGKSDLAPFEEVGYTQGSWAVGENLAWGGGRLGAPLRALRSWLNSRPHRDAVFGRDWVEVGAAVHPIENFRGESSGQIWVSHFGRRQAE